VSGANRADRVEAVLRQADATLEKWFRRAKKQSVRLARHQADNLQAGLKKLSARLAQLEREPNAITLAKAAPSRTVPAKRRPRPAIARKPSSPRKPKKAA
jgi:hypothetical protein